MHLLPMTLVTILTWWLNTQSPTTFTPFTLMHVVITYTLDSVTVCLTYALSHLIWLSELLHEWYAYDITSMHRFHVLSTPVHVSLDKLSKNFCLSKDCLHLTVLLYHDFGGSKHTYVLVNYDISRHVVVCVRLYVSTHIGIFELCECS